ncbi:PAS domain-containing protein [Deinococcus multiflagellatus]|uniref:PAS domain-containing protein n=1 Tax=Deinococcus multiflagellatus TaxID=1656887 RepID=UPI001CCA219F|nr:PAS domain S-box protein [Deinococcus multiflagellatus]MBZ9713887.1 PAS domain S-box protein [Deinococcus multiflagellatus]
MRPGLLELRWAYLLFALLALNSFLVVWLVPRPQAFWVLAPLVAVQLIAAWLAPRIVRMVRGHRLLQESYAEELAFARQLMESVEHGLTVTDEDGRFVYVNRAYAELLGTTPERVLGRTPFEFTLPEDHARLQAARAERRGGQSSSYRTRLRRPDGALVDVVVTGTPRWHAGRIVGNVAAVVPLRDLGEG